MAETAETVISDRNLSTDHWQEKKKTLLNENICAVWPGTIVNFVHSQAIAVIFYVGFWSVIKFVNISDYDEKRFLAKIQKKIKKRNTTNNNNKRPAVPLNIACPLSARILTKIKAEKKCLQMEH